MKKVNVFYSLQRPPSRCSSGSSLHLDDQPVRDTDKPGTPKKQKKSGRGTPKKTKKKSKPPSPQGSPGKSKPPSSPRVTPKKSRQKANETTPNTTPKKSKKKANRSYDSEPTHHDESDLNVLRITKLSPHNKSLTEYDDMDSMSKWTANVLGMRFTASDYFIITCNSWPLYYVNSLELFDYT